MKLLCWNSRGLWNPQGVRVLFDLNLREGPNVLFLMKTKLLATQLDTIKWRLGMHACTRENNEGRAGGLVVMWKDTMDIQLCSFSRYHMHTSIKPPNGSIWLFMGFYGHPNAARKEIT